MIKQWLFVTTFSVFSFLSAFEEVVVDEKTPLQIVFSQKQINRIEVAGGDIKKLATRCPHIAIDFKSGQDVAYVTFSHPVIEPAILTVETDFGTQDISFTTAEDKLLEVVKLKEAPYEDEALKQLSLKKAHKKITPQLFVETVAQGRMVEGFNASSPSAKDAFSKNGFLFKPLVVFTNPKEKVVVYEVSNRHNRSGELTETIVARGSERWIWVGKKQLKKTRGKRADKTFCFISWGVKDA